MNDKRFEILAWALLQDIMNLGRWVDSDEGQRWVIERILKDYIAISKDDEEVIPEVEDDY